MRPVLKVWWIAGLVVLLGAAGLGGGMVALALHTFPDVPDGAFYHDDVEWLKDNNITFGCGGGNYCPNDNVTRGQIAAFLHRQAGVQVVAGYHVRRGFPDTPEIDQWFNNVNGVAPVHDGAFDTDVGFATNDKFFVCSVDTNFVDTRDALCTVNNTGTTEVRVRPYDISAGTTITAAEYWVLVYGLDQGRP